MVTKIRGPAARSGSWGVQEISRGNRMKESPCDGHFHSSFRQKFRLHGLCLVRSLPDMTRSKCGLLVSCLLSGTWAVSEVIWCPGHRKLWKSKQLEPKLGWNIEQSPQNMESGPKYWKLKFVCSMGLPIKPLSLLEILENPNSWSMNYQLATASWSSSWCDRSLTAIKVPVLHWHKWQERQLQTFSSPVTVSATVPCYTFR